MAIKWLNLSISSFLLVQLIYTNDFHLSKESNNSKEISSRLDSKKGEPFGFVDRKPEICFTKKCQILGKQLKTWMNESINPCNDFHEFVCGNYDENSLIEPDMIYTSNFDEANLNIQKVLRKQLSEPDIDCEPDSVKYASNMFKGCIDFKTLETIGVKPLLDLLKEVYNGWPIVGDLAPFKLKNWDIFDKLAKSIALLSEFSILELNVFPCIKNTTKNCFHIAPSPTIHLAVGLIEQIQNRSSNPWLPPSPPMIKKPRILKNISRETFEDIEREYYAQQVSIIGGNVTTDTNNQIQKVMDLSTQLGQCLTPALNFNESFREVTFHAFNELTQIDWLKFVNKIYNYTGSNIRFTKKDKLFVMDLNYFICLKTILFNTDKKVLANYLGFCFVNDFGVYTVQAFRDLSFKLFQQIYGAERPKPHWMRCVKLIRNGLGFAISRKYVDKYFTISRKSQVTELTGYVKNAFEKLLETNPILSKNSREVTLNKLRNVTINVGFPDWIYDDKTIDSLYLLTQKCDPANFINCLVHFTSRFSYRIYDSISYEVNKTISSWPYDPTVINAAYYGQYNSITIPVGFINTFYTCEYPRAYIHGTLAVILGHEFTHGFDSNGHQFDHFGDYNSIFDEMTTKSFYWKEECFIDQYNQFCDPNLNICVDGTLTVGENTADNGGIREAYSAFKMFNRNKSSPKVLPFVSNYTADQLFFISFASVWCEKLRPEYVSSTYTDVHSPAKFRVNGVVSNTKAFSDAFDCLPNSPMNPKNKCILW